MIIINNAWKNGATNARTDHALLQLIIKCFPLTNFSFLATRNQLDQQYNTKLTFLVVSEELQLFLLLPAQGVDDGDGQSQCFPWVTVRSQCIYPGAGRGDVFCDRNQTSDGHERNIFTRTQKASGTENKKCRSFC